MAFEMLQLAFQLTTLQDKQKLIYLIETTIFS